MGKIMEALFCAFYLIFTSVMGILILRKAKDSRKTILFGIMTLILVFGDAFHLVPRILVAVNPTGDYHVSLGIGKLITSITMTIFYVVLYFFFEMHYGRKSTALRCAVFALALIRIALCMFPQNDWTGEAPVAWGIYRNIPFALLGLVTIVLFFTKRKDRDFRPMWFAILMSFAFYIPVVLWADVSPMVGMLMLPKTCMYMWIVVMGYRQAKRALQ